MHESHPDRDRHDCDHHDHVLRQRTLVLAHRMRQAGQLTIASDGDAAGREAASALAARADALGWRVTLLPAPEGLDWNDVLLMKGEAA